MLLSFSKRFLFVANTKTGSTTIEQNLRRHAEISIPTTRLGKHMTYHQVTKNFKFAFRKSEAQLEQFFRFGVIREPVDWVVSWYNYRHRDALNLNPARKNKSTRDLSFEEFATELMKSNERSKYARIGRQYSKFIKKDGSLGVDYLIPLRRIDEELEVIVKELGINKKIAPEKKQANVSDKIMRASDVPQALADQIRTHFVKDLELFKKAESGGFGNVADVIRAKLGDPALNNKKARKLAKKKQLEALAEAA